MGDLMMTDIYDQHRAAFANVSAYVILQGSERVATVAIKYPRDGAGRLYAYVHILGLQMVRGFVNGYGYDKRSAAVSDAIRRLCKQETPASTWPLTVALSLDGGDDWTRAVEKAGFTVLQAV